MLIVPQNISAPQSITLIFQSPSLGANLTTVTSATASVLRSDGTTAMFALTIVSQTPAELVAQYVFASGDITATGVYYLTGNLSLPGGVARAQAIAMYVTAPNSSQPRTEESAWLAATSTVSGAVVSQTWTIASSSETLTPFAPLVIADSRAGAITLTLWVAQDGDGLIVNDAFGAFATHNVTLIAAAGQQVPTGPGTYANSVVLSTAGQSLRLKYSATLSKWIAW